MAFCLVYCFVMLPFYRHPLFRIWFWSLLGFALLHVLAVELFLYWIYPWFDLLTHFLGGALVSIGVFWFVFESPYVLLEKRPITIVLALSAAIVVIGVAWEVFEFLTGVTRGEDSFVRDTAADLVMDSIGALCGGWYAARISRTSHDKSHE